MSRRGLGDSTTSSFGDNTMLFQDSDEVNSYERSAEMKVTKAKRRMTKKKKLMFQEMMNSVTKSQELMEKQHACYLATQARIEAHADLLMSLKQEELAMKEKELRLKADKQGMEIMEKDLSNLTPFSKQFWSNKKQAIVDSGNIPRVARNLNFSEGGSG